MKFNKIFGIGFHKTGVSSLAIALKILGFRTNKGVLPLRELMNKQEYIELLKNKEYQIYYDVLENYDATLDNPWYILYKELDQKFPNSKFILTIRDDNKWLDSAKNFFSGNKNEIHQIIYGVTHIESNEDLYLNRYKKHNQEVLKYFKGRENDLLILNWENGDGWKELCSFLNKPIVKLPFPHFNNRHDLTRDSGNKSGMEKSK